MNLNLKNMGLSLALAFSLTACNFYDKASNQEGTAATILLGPQFPACYLNNCFETQPISKLNDPNKDYQYPNPAEFPRSELRNQYIAPSSVLDLAKLNPEELLTDHFKLRDFMSANYGQYALYSANVVTNLELIRRELGKAVIINSGFRSPGHNREIDGSAKWSRHTYGDGVDFTVNGVGYKQLQALCLKYKASFTLIYAKHIHCDWRRSPLDPSFYNQANFDHNSEIDIFETARQLSAQSKILETAKGNEIELTVQLPVEDELEEGMPIFDWQIILPTGDLIVGDSATIHIPRIPGRTQIKVTIGNSIELKDSRLW